MEELKYIYIQNIEQALSRLKVTKEFLEIYLNSSKQAYLESAILQLRKTLELLAFAAIAPYKTEYAKFRLKAESRNDYRKDYKASTIVKILKNINKDFYPIPLSEPFLVKEGYYHFERQKENFLTINNFIRLYDKLGKYLHADNPWGHDKNLKNFVDTLPKEIKAIESLLSLYFTTIRTDNFIGVWVIKTTSDPISVEVTVGYANEDFSIK